MSVPKPLSCEAGVCNQVRGFSQECDMSIPTGVTPGSRPVMRSTGPTAVVRESLTLTLDLVESEWIGPVRVLSFDKSK